VIEITPIDVTSMKVVKSELTASIEKASRHFESFITDRSQSAQLNESLAALQEVSGILKIMSVQGATDLVNEMLILLNEVISSPEKVTDIVLSALSHAFVGLPCYIEYIIDKSQALPYLLLVFINELRTARKQPIIPESSFCNYQTESYNWDGDIGEPVEDVAGVLKRQRQLFQIGLIGMIREENLELKIKLMHRAIQRAADSLGQHAAVSSLRLAEGVYESMLAGALYPTYTRKRLFSQLDRLLRDLSKDTASFNADEDLNKELIFLNHLGLCDGPVSAKINQQLSLSAPNLNDKQAQAERSLMQGPNADTIITMVSALREELAQTKEVLEIAAQGVSQASDFENVVTLFQRSAEILKVVGLTSTGQLLFDMKNKVASWVGGAEYEKEELLEIADGLIYIESVMANISRMDLNFDASDLDKDTKRKLMSKSQLDEAQVLVLQESQAAIAIAKKDISSFIESNYDTSHLQQIIETLSSVKGGIAILGHNQAGAVLASCMKFVQYIIDNGIDNAKSDSILETLADALIATEYYLSEIEMHNAAPPGVLTVAEQSLESLGFPVEA